MGEGITGRVARVRDVREDPRCVHDKIDAFDEKDEELLSTVAIRNARMFEKLRGGTSLPLSLQMGE